MEMLKLLAAGIGMGWGPCLAFWGPVLLPYIAATRQTWQEGLRVSSMFSLGRLLALAILGGVATVAFASLNHFFPPHRSGYLYLAIALFVVLLGVLILLGKGFRLPIYHILDKYMEDGSSGGMLLLGFLIGISPCMPLIAILTYIAYSATNPLDGVIYALSFGIGTVVPVLLLGTFAGFVAQRILGRARLLKVFTIICGTILILFGLQLIYGISQVLW